METAQVRIGNDIGTYQYGILSKLIQLNFIYQHDSICKITSLYSKCDKSLASQQDNQIIN